MRFIRERWRLLLSLAFLAVALWTAGIVSIGAYVNRRGCVSMANYHRIQVGISRANVEALLGGPGGPAPVLFRVARIMSSEENRPYEVKRPYLAEQWVNGRLSITVHFDHSDRVESASWTRNDPITWYEIMSEQLKPLP